MSQGNNIQFSVRRPRETLGAINNFSGIPQPASALRKASSNTDLRAPYTAQHARSTSIQSVQRPPQPNFLPRSSSGSNLAEMGQSTVRRSASNNIFANSSNNRQSLAPGMSFAGSQTPGSFQRRSSVYSRPSNNGPSAHQSFFTQPPAPATKPTDPRPFRDGAYRSKISQELLDYLTRNNFELEMKHSLTQKTLATPTGKDFQYIFEWLYRRIDPGYKFMKPLDHELPPILAQLRYPYAKDITKSMIAAASSSQHWPKFLGLLHWMLQLAQMLDNFTRGAYDDVCAEAGVDVSSDRIVFRFLFGAYQDWVNVGPEDTDEDAEAVLVPHIKAMAAEFERTNAKYEEELKMYEAENQALKAQVDEIEKSTPDIAKLDKHFKILEEDKKKFEDYNANVQAKIEKYDARIKILNDEVQKTEADLKVIESERISLQQAVDRQGISIQDIDRMNTERERLQTNLESTLAMLEEANRVVLEKEADTSRKLEELEAVIKRYNSLGYQMSLIPSTAANAKGHDYELTLDIADASNFRSSRSQRNSPDTDRLLADTNIGHSPVHLLNLDVRGAVRQAFLSLRKEISQRRKEAAEKDLNDREIIDNVNEALHEKSNEIETLNHRVTEAGRAYNSLKESSSTAHVQSMSAIEKLEKELSRLRENLNAGVMELEQKEMEVGVAWEGMQTEAGQVREELHGNVERMLEEVVRFKLHVQRSLEEWEKGVGEEVERELEGGEEEDGRGAL
jgi:kinetochore protein NDC80